MTLTPEQRPTLTISESGVVLTETYDGNEVPAEYSFSIVNDYVHAHGRHFEELQYLALGMASHIDAQQTRIAELEAQLTRIQRLADCGTVQNWLALPDEDKARWFAVTVQRDSEHCKLIAELEQDAARYRWLRDKMLGVDFDWNESGLTALCFEMPDGCAYGGNCDQNINAAMQK